MGSKQEAFVKHGTSRRDFVKAAVAASLAGTAASPPAAQAKQPSDAAAARKAFSAPSGPITFPRVFTGRSLARISCPLGGIGTGGIGLGGRGNLQDWQIFNRPNFGNTPQFCFPSLWVHSTGSAPFATVLERRFLPPFDTGADGFGPGGVPGLPRLAEAHFHGSFPLSRIEFEDPDCPVQISLEAFSPFFPLEADSSGLPCAVLDYSLHNPASRSAEAVIAWSISNPIGHANSRSNESRSAQNLAGVQMSDPALAPDHPMQGTIVLAALAPVNSVEVLPRWPGNSWFNPQEHFWFDSFAPTGSLGAPSEPSTPVASISIRQTIPARATRSFRFLLAWRFPNRTPKSIGWEAPKGEENTLIGNYYCTRFPDAWAAAQYTAANLPELEAHTRAFVSALAQSTLPAEVKDAASANLSTLASNTSFRIADGSFHAFEGCGDHGGLGFGTCTHVWNYEMATQFLFPSLARSMRETNFGYCTDAEGHMDFRHKLPLGKEHWGAAAADGQMGQIVKLYCDWALTADDDWLRRQWPAAKRALAYAWRPGGWDERKSGVMDGVQHNTYDVEFYGPNSMCTTWYLAALRAMARMAQAMDELDLAAECNRMADAGSRWVDAHLFNGEYYIQQVRGIPRDQIASGLLNGAGARDPMHPDYQLGDGCFADQLIGQQMASVAGLGDLLSPAHMRSALDSIHRYNFKPSLAHHANPERVYALNNQAGLVVLDFTRGTRPAVPVPYSTEVWTGLEYSVAGLMLSHGMTAEALELIRAARLRYDGESANPYAEIEYGRHYTRPMASWGPIPILSGFRYDARARRMTLQPRIHADRFQCFWAAPQAWGSFALTRQSLILTVAAGSIPLRELLIAPAFAAPAKLRVTSGSNAVAFAASTENNATLLRFPSEVSADKDHPLRIEA
jgi:uncharacterized protein (DUF608 family)